MKQAWIVIIALAALATGCGESLPQIPGLGGRASDEEQIATVLNDVQRGMEARKIYKVLAHVSRNYLDEEGRDYEAIREYLSGIVKAYREIRITRTSPKILVQGDRARAIESFGTVAEPADQDETPAINLQGQVAVYLERVDGAWQIVEWGPIH